MHDSLVGRKKFSALLLWEFFVISVFPSTDKIIIEINTSLPKGEDSTKNCNRASLRYSKKVKGSRTTTEDIPKIPTPLHATSRGGRGRFVSNANSHLSPKEERKIGITLGYPEYLSDAKRAWKPLHYWGNRFIRELTNATFLSHGLQLGVGCFPM